MFLKKHSQPEWTPADRQRERLLLDYFAAETNLEEKAKAVIVRKGVIDLYPDGPDKDRAIKDFEAAQHSLLCAIGTVDGLRNDTRSSRLRLDGQSRVSTFPAIPSSKRSTAISLRHGNKVRS